MSFAGKVVLVTGSTTGIGEACAHVFAESGAKVMVRASTSNAAARWSRPSVARAAACQFAAADLRAAGACERLIGDTIERLVASISWCNNARILYTANALETSDQQWLETMAVNVNALFYLSRAAVRHMKAVGKGRSSNVASEWGFNGEAESCGLLRQQGSGRSDHPLHGIDHARDNIRVNSVCPGEIHTRMVDEFSRKRGGDHCASLRELAPGSDAPLGASDGGRALRAFPGIRPGELRDRARTRASTAAMTPTAGLILESPGSLPVQQASPFRRAWRASPSGCASPAGALPCS